MSTEATPQAAAVKKRPVRRYIYCGAGRWVTLQWEPESIAGSAEPSYEPAFYGTAGSGALAALLIVFLLWVIVHFA